MNSTEESSRVILLIDDEEAPNVFYVRALERAGFRVERRTSVDDALDFARGAIQKLALVILDVMMPFGRSYSAEDADDGLRTGVLVYKDIRALSSTVPILVLTVVRNPDILACFEDEPRLKVIRKLDCTPRQLVQQVGEMIRKAEQH